MSRPAKLYFSLRSPYSWLAINRLRDEVPGALEQLVCLPYWDPDTVTGAGLDERGGEFHYVQMSRAKHLYMLMDTKRIAEGQGRKMAWPIDIDPWWELPHLAWLRARREGVEWPFYDALNEARWGRGDNICEPDVVRAAAERAGFDPELAVGAVDDPEIRAEGVDCLYQAYLDDIFGIPYFKWGRHRFWGFDRLDAFLEVWRPAAREERAA
ncbi:2-hydroxychromene-2-carboxylate isomerase [Amycolatopsis umgeniensis]|uniref:2-hydroxychromene-2-carboxylate isomerase n=1 Tax=Amycolatopsis umgeniensis TaxID=336628 RepID=A0A841B2G0_9PSEU|nr:2-hydroxychromene-2-carboxylate isomerase [Amycolatopsis umgeniensis]